MASTIDDRGQLPTHCGSGRNRPCSAIPLARGFVILEGNDLSEYQRKFGNKPVSELDSRGNCFTIYGAQRFGIW